MKRNFGHFLEIFTQYFFFHAHFFLRLIIEFYEKKCKFFAFFWISRIEFGFHALKTIFFHAKEPIFHVEKKTLPYQIPSQVPGPGSKVLHLSPIPSPRYSFRFSGPRPQVLNIRSQVPDLEFQIPSQIPGPRSPVLWTRSQLRYQVPGPRSQFPNPRFLVPGFMSKVPGQGPGVWGHFPGFWSQVSRSQVSVLMSQEAGLRFKLLVPGQGPSFYVLDPMYLPSSHVSVQVLKSLS